MLTVTDGGRVVVAGAGLAGLRTAAELRERGFTGQITLIGAEVLPPYDRPPLSKKVLTDERIDPSLQADFGALEVDFRPGEAATGMDAEALVTSRDKYPYDRLVLATGALPVALPGPGRQRFLRNYDDALALRALLRPGLRMVIVGAGWIGAELATAAAARGAEVTVVEAGPAPLASAVGAPVGAQTARWYAADQGEALFTSGFAPAGLHGFHRDPGSQVHAGGGVPACGLRAHRGPHGRGERSGPGLDHRDLTAAGGGRGGQFGADPARPHDGQSQPRA